MLSLVARIRSLVRGVRRGVALNDDMDAEFGLHMELRAADLVSAGLTPAEAARQTRLEFGSTASFRDRGRDARGLRAFDNLRFSMLDLKLGARMLVKHPTLTAIATIAVAFAIAAGTVGFEIARQALWPTIPLPNGNAIVALQNWDVAESVRRNASRRDYALWKDGLTTITDVGAIVLQERNVAVGVGAGQPDEIANVTASTFAMTGVPALMGRTLLDADERADAEEVAVIGYDFWRNKLDGAADAVGRLIHVSGTPVTIVGVMPPGYAFPQRHDIWRPLHLERLPEASPALGYVFGRLAPGRAREEAEAEVAAIGARTATMFPLTHKNVRLQLLSLPQAVSGLPAAATLVFASINVFLVLLLALLCGNVAMLLFARAAARETELVVRAALGANRARLIMQLFAEALTLCAVGAVVGLVAAHFTLAWTSTIIEGEWGRLLPFWIDVSLSPATILYGAGLTVFAAAIAGVVPALKVTSSDVVGRLRAASSGGGGLQFGGVWTAVIVAQIALTTVLPVPLAEVGGAFVDARNMSAGFAADAFLTATLALDRLDGVAASGDTLPTARAARLEAHYGSLADRLRLEPGVVDVTYANALPLMRLRWTTIEVDSGPAATYSRHCSPNHCTGFVSVDPRFFDVVGAPVTHGRALTTADAEQATRAVLVNELFVNRVMGGRNPIGRRLRLPSTNQTTAGSWYHIVGVVPDLGVSYNEDDLGGASIYQATLPRETGPLRIAIRVHGDPQRFTVRLRELAQKVNPALRVIASKPLPFLKDEQVKTNGFLFKLLVTLMSVTMMLSLAGVYAVTTFAVGRRTREIGVRVALGAQRTHILATVFKRPMVQVALGIGVGTIMALLLGVEDKSDLPRDYFARAGVFALSTSLCCALACIVPTRRALRIQPTEALKDEG